MEVLEIQDKIKKAEADLKSTLVNLDQKVKEDLNSSDSWYNRELMGIPTWEKELRKEADRRRIKRAAMLWAAHRAGRAKAEADFQKTISEIEALIVECRKDPKFVAEFDARLGGGR